jgi:hypothetical protein
VDLLQLLQHQTLCDGQDRLTNYIHKKMWPEESSPKFFYMAATAAKETGNIDWLIGAYKGALTAHLRKATWVFFSSSSVFTSC